jgi:catechol 2,3-dioxygenase-like lactoylglutathione lyase family enzyme
MATTLTSLMNVAIPVTDQDRAVGLFTELGFETLFDAELQEGFRWVELGIPGTDDHVALVRSGDELPAGIDTGIRFGTADARAAHATVQRLGLDAGELLDRESAPLMFSFADQDGNRFYVTETG